MEKVRVYFVKASQCFDILTYSAVTLLLGVLAVWFTAGLVDIVMFHVNDVFYRDMAIYKKIPVMLMLVVFSTAFVYKIARFVINIPFDIKDYARTTKSITGYKIQNIIKNKEKEI